MSKIHFWTPDHTEQFLAANPLPVDFVWPHREAQADGTDNLQPVLPSYAIHKGYGFWLRTTPYFPGLFHEIHGILSRLPGDADLPTPEELAAQLDQIRADRGTQTTLL